MVSHFGNEYGRRGVTLHDAQGFLYAFKVCFQTSKNTLSPKCMYLTF